MNSVPSYVYDFLGDLDLVQEFDGYWTARCPGHDDTNPSLSVRVSDKGYIQVKCFAGCSREKILEGAGKTKADLRPPAKQRRRQSSADVTRDASASPDERGAKPPKARATLQQSGLTLEEYADAKKLDPERLPAWGVSTHTYAGRKALRIAYRDEAGNETATRYRKSLEQAENGDGKFAWTKGSKISLYGLDRLAHAKEAGEIFLVEGESDCHTLWQFGEHAVGLPGAATFNEARDVPLLADIPIIYAVIEPDGGGEGLLRKLGKSVLLDQILVVDFGEHKDPSGLHLDDPDRFPDRLAEIKAHAVPLRERLAAEELKRAQAAWEICQDLAKARNILERFAEEMRVRGVAGDLTPAKVVFLALISRLFSHPISVAVKGPSSAGKSFLVMNVLAFLPEDCYVVRTAMSEKALIYSEEPISHKFLILFEAAGMGSGFSKYIMRSLLSEHQIKYETVEKTPEGLRPRFIVREGPTGLIVTTTETNLHPENETRLVSITLVDTQEQTRAIMQALANGSGAKPDLQVWHELQVWLAHGATTVTIPYSGVLADLIPPMAVRLRRDFESLLNLIRAHALLHRATREIAEDGSVVATLDDYSAAKGMLEPLLAASIEASVPEPMRETVEAVAKLSGNSSLEYVSVSALARELRLDKSSASRRAAQAAEHNYLVNVEHRKGKPAQYVVDAPLPENIQFLPDRCTVAAKWEEIAMHMVVREIAAETVPAGDEALQVAMLTENASKTHTRRRAKKPPPE